METLGSGGEGDGKGGLPATGDIQMEDCTMALLAVNKELGDATDELNNRVIESGPGSTTYDCKACPARLRDAGFSNISGSIACRSAFLQEATNIIARR